MKQDNYQVIPFSDKKVDLDVKLPGSKSITNRAFIFAALAKGKTKLENMLLSDDTVYMRKALMELGINVEMNEAKKECVIHGGKIPEGRHDLFVGNAGTAMRFLTSYLCLGNGEFVLDGDERMRERPIEDLLKALSQLGCKVVSKNNNGCPPVVISASGIGGGECEINGANSSQYISSLLMTAPYSSNGITIKTASGVSSKPYVDMTLRMMKRFGVDVSRNGYQKFSVSRSVYRPLPQYVVEPDASSASYFLGAAAILSGTVRIRGLGKNSIQGDARFAEILARMGCHVEYTEDDILLKSDGKLKGITVDMNALPDMVPTLAVLALFADGPTKINNIATLRIKESDRIHVMATELTKIGATVNEFDDGLEVFPKKCYNSALILTHNDHRIAMAFSVAGLKIEGITIENPSCVGKSFPDYFDYFELYFG